MKSNMPVTIDEYIAQRPADIQPILKQLRQTILEAAPDATEKISWGMATFVYHGNLVHFSAETRHIGFHPTPSAIEAFQTELSGYSCSKGTVRFPYTQPLPWNLIKQMVAFRVKEQTALVHANKTGQKATPVSRARYPMPDDVKQALQQEELTAQYEVRPPYQRNDYIGWITRAKRPETRQKRLYQMLQELRTGDAYMGMPYSAKQ